MAPVIDVHEHIFRGIDIPLEGYLRSRSYPWYIRMFSWLLFPVVARSIRRRHASETNSLPAQWVMKAVYAYMGEGYKRWAAILSERDVARIAERLVETFREDGIELFVPLMIDYEYWFRNTRDTQLAHQINSISMNVVVPFGGMIHPFVPFDPARELAHQMGLPKPDDPEDGPTEEFGSMDLVKDAIRNRGFIGVKLYNTLGYRPLGNAAVNERQKWLFRRNGMERYAKFRGEDFDRVLLDFYEFCMKEQVPITAHCLSDGIESFPGASLLFGSPQSWRPVLERFPALHLNLAHFGWSHGLRYAAARRGFFPRWVHDDANWVRTICGMIRDHPNLYVDVAHHEVIGEDAESRFRADYKEMYGNLGGRLQKRLLFGIDWHVITRMDGFECFKAAYERILGGDGTFTPEEMKDFFGGNAVRFLGLLPSGTEPSQGWTRNRERLDAFYRNNSIRPPAWFVASGKAT